VLRQGTKITTKQHRAAKLGTSRVFAGWTNATQHVDSGNICMVICFLEVGVVVAVRVRWTASCCIVRYKCFVFVLRVVKFKIIVFFYPLF
jgi:hypothetical protein